MGRQQLLLSLVKPLILLNMKEWRLGWEHKFFLATLIASQVIGVISAFDCRRYVFAPICRGVTSKRATISPLVGNNHAIYDLILKQIKKQQEENKYNSEQVKEDTKDIDSDLHSANELKPRKRDSWDLNDLGSFTSFYRKRLYKRNAPYLDDLDTKRARSLGQLEQYCNSDSGYWFCGCDVWINCKILLAIPEGRIVIATEYLRIFSSDHHTIFSFVDFRLIPIWMYNRHVFLY